MKPVKEENAIATASTLFIRANSLKAMSQKPFFCACLNFFILLLFLIPSLYAGDPTLSEQRGRQIYFEGKSPRGNAITGFVGKEKVKVPGTVATCGSCHGADGLGRPEAGVIPSNIRWNYLSKPYGNTSPTGRKFPAYDEDALKECIVDGYDPGGNRLDTSMPTYDMTDEDLDDLIAYLKKLEFDYDPGLTKTTLRIGTILPSVGRLGELGRSMGEVLRAYFDEVNARGGIYNRKIELVESDYGFGKESALQEAKKLIGEKRVFALVGPVIAGADREIAEMAESEKMPLVGPFTLFSADPYTLSDYTFYIFSGLKEQARALVDFAAAELKLESPRVALLAPDDDYHGNVRDAISEQCSKHGWAPPNSITTFGAIQDARGVAEKLKEYGAGAVFFYAAGGLPSLAGELAKIGYEPYIFLPGAMTKRELLDLPPGFHEKVYLSYPSLPSDWTQAGLGEIGRMLDKRGIPPTHRAARISAYVAAKILVEGLKRTGRELSREKLRLSLEKIYEYQTGLTPRITYGVNRRIGALGAHIVTVDLKEKQFKPTGKWVEPK
jgi:ABC-type branched-subunit amino acid transport system substrate-binding protein